MRRLVLATAFVLSGCVGTYANTHFKAATPPAQADASGDWWSCSQQAWHAYYQGRSNGWLLFGAGGGLVGMAAGSILDAGYNAQSPQVSTMKTSDVVPMINRCMTEKGYIGSS